MILYSLNKALKRMPVGNKINPINWNLQWHLHRVALRPLIPDGIWKCWFLWREENPTTRRKTLGARTRTNNKLNPHMTPGTGIEPGPHWWEASDLTTAPSLFPENIVWVCSSFVTLMGLQRKHSESLIPKYLTFHMLVGSSKHWTTKRLVTWPCTLPPEMINH